MYWRIALDRFRDERRPGFRHLPMPQVLPLPGTMALPGTLARRIDPHPAQTWATFFSGIEQGNGDATGTERD